MDKVGVYICSGYGIGEALDLEALKQVAETELKAEVVKIVGSVEAEDLELINQEVAAEGINRLVVAGPTFRFYPKNAFPASVMVDYVNLREQVAWAHEPNNEDTQALAADNLRMGVTRVRKMAPLEPVPECNSINKDILVVGGGPAGLTAAYYLAKASKKVILFERKLSVGGGMWGGGVMFNEIVVQAEGKRILDEFGIRSVPFEDDYFSADSVETVSTMCSQACKAGAKIFNLFSVEDVMLTEGRVTGLVINWSAVDIARLHVDPITIRAKAVIDATGHAAEVANVIQRKSGVRLDTPSGKIEGERPMWAEVGEKMIVENTREFFPGVFAAGMCCNAIYGAPRMGPVFGGMLMSGKKVAEMILARLMTKPE